MRTYRPVFFILLLAACTPDFPPPEPIEFGSDPRILRGEWVGEATLEAPVVPLSYSPDGSYLFAAEAFENAIYDTETFDVVARLELDEGDAIDTAQFSLEGSALATTRKVVGSDDVTVSLWNALTGEHLETLSFRGNPAGFSTDLRRFATLSNNQEQGTEVAVWELSSKSRLNFFTLSKDYENVQVSPDFTTVAALERNGDTYTAFLWSIATQGTLLEFSLNSGSNAGNLLFSADGSLLAIKYSDRGFIYIWDVDASEFLLQSDEITGELLTFSADGTKLATISEGKDLRIWDVQSGSALEEAEFILERGGSTLLFTPQLEQVALEGLDGSLQVLDLASGDTLAEIAVVETYDLGVNVNATYVDESSYNLAGTLEFEGETYAVQGEVVGGGEQTYLRPTRSLPSPAYFEMQALDQAGEVRWILEGSAPYYDTYDDLSDEALFEGVIVRSEAGWSRSFLLRQP